MQEAAPTFTKADDTFKLQGAKVADLCVDIKGREHHSDWIQTIVHPDAHLIAAAPELFHALSGLLDIHMTTIGLDEFMKSDDMDKFCKLLAKALGEV